MPRYFPEFEEFERIVTAGAQVVPVWRQLLADRLTPVTAFELLGGGTHGFLLESVVGIEKIGRYSFIATSPRFVYQVKDGRGTIERLVPQAPLEEFDAADPLAVMGRLLPAKRYHHDKRLPNFTGGLVGFAGYAVR